MDEQSILELKAKRTTLKAKVTTLVNKVIRPGASLDLLSDFTKLTECFDAFQEVHYEFAEYVSSEEYSKHSAVNNLEPSEYLEQVETLYSKACRLYQERKLDAIVKNSEVLIDTVNSIETGNIVATDRLDMLTQSKGFLSDLLVHNDDESYSDTVERLKAVVSKLSISCNVTPVVYNASRAQSSEHASANRGGSEGSAAPAAVGGLGASRSGAPLEEVDVPLQETGLFPNSSSELFTANNVEIQQVSAANHTRQSILRVTDLLQPSEGNVNSKPGAFLTSVVSAYDKVPNGTLSLSMTEHNHPGNVVGNYDAPVRPKRVVMPTPFFGDRRRWPEFRSVWLRYANLELYDDFDRVTALKELLKGEALEFVSSIYATQPEAYKRIMAKLDEIYSDPSLCVDSVMNDLQKLQKFKDNDWRGLVKFASDLETSYCQLGEVGHINAITMPQIDKIADLLPMTLQREWMKIVSSLSSEEKIRPFRHFMAYMEKEKGMAIRLAEREKHQNLLQPKSATKTNASTFYGISNEISTSMEFCVMHNNKSHSLANCHSFLALPIKQRYEVLRYNLLCFQCFGEHPRRMCNNVAKCRICGKVGHHVLLCKRNEKLGNSCYGVTQSDNPSYHNRSDNESAEHRDQALAKDAVTNSNHGKSQEDGDRFTIFPVQKVQVVGSKRTANVFFDGGSDSTFITAKAARRLGAKKLGKINLDVCTLGNKERSEVTYQYEIRLWDNVNQEVTVLAYGLEQITSAIQPLDMATVSQLFPSINAAELMRESGSVDILIGNDYFGLHPKIEVARSGEHLSVLRGVFGLCIQGSHPKMSNIPAHSSISACARANGCYSLTRITRPLHREFSKVVTLLNKASKAALGDFIMGEELAVEVEPRCGSCRCGNCPVKGHTYSFKEEQELQMIRSNLQYDENNKRWITSYPWLVDPSTLPNNYPSALSTLRSTEATLLKDKKWANVYKEQIQDMVDRQVARRLSQKEATEWEGPVYYISHLAVLNPKSESTPVRIVFNSSQIYKGVSLNSCLAKGPDAYLNNLLRVILRWREDKIACVGDITKMYNSIYTTDIEQHTHRFLWRDFQQREPDIYVINRVNMGDRPAAAISSEAIYKTADLCLDRYPRVTQLLKNNTYVDDIVDSFENKYSAEQVAYQTQRVLDSAGFRVKCWIFSGENGKRVSLEDKPEPRDVPYSTQVLGILWIPVSDQIAFLPKINFSCKRRGVYTEPDLTAQQIPSSIPETLTRRIVLEQAMKVYDPLGILCPVTFRAKHLLRETWRLQLSWDDQLPRDMREKWIDFFRDLFRVEQQTYSRCLKPENAEGLPSLVIFSDASKDAYGFSAYIRWKLSDGTFWCRLIMAKCRIAPIKQLTIPQMELNGAVLSKRGRKVIESETRFNYEKIYQLIDSETVLCMLNKVSTRFKLYEGVRVGEIQSATEGDMTSWHWIRSSDNTADWLTRGKSVKDVGPESEWWCGPSFLYLPEDQWDIRKSSGEHTTLPGEKRIVNVASGNCSLPFIEYANFRSMTSLEWTMTRVRNMVKQRSFSAGRGTLITVRDLQETRAYIIREVQKGFDSRSFAKLKPVRTEDGVWVIGSRLARQNPMTSIKCHLQKLLPNSHPFTKLALQQAHVDSGHRGRDSTLARFREEYWTSQGAKVARQVTANCQECKRRFPKLLNQSMAQLPRERITTGPPFNYSMVDLFGPFQIRGEVNKRANGKAYGVLFTDLVSRAVHIEGVYGYDTNSFLLALKRFVSIRGWPRVIFSDPGTQLIGAEKELKEVWKSIEQAHIQRITTENGLDWRFGPADSPWYQGAAEALIKTVKRCLQISLGSQRLSASEFSTVCYETANLVNERPLGTLPSDDSEISILTPNCLLIGRPFSRNPGEWKKCNSLKNRLHLVVSVVEDFWKKWIELYAPTLVSQNKWHGSQRNLRVGDVVLVADANCLRKQYRLAKVHEVFPSRDGKVRKVSVSYKNYKVKGKSINYTSAKDTIVTRSVHRLALLVPVDD